MTQQATSSSASAAPLPTATVVSPEIMQGNRVTFRIFAPEAHQVFIAGDWSTQGRSIGDPLEKGDGGVWWITVELSPEFYTYTFTVDGVRTIDPANTWIKPGSLRVQNICAVPGEAMAFADTCSVPHGDVRMVWYDSPTTQSVRRMHIYTPPGYDGSDERYPVLYLVHGGGDDDAAWPTIGRAGFIMDNLLAAGKTKPMIIVMPNGKIDLPGFTLFLSDEEKQSPPAVQRRIETISRLHDTFVQDLLTTIIPTVEKSFRVLPERESRAIAGLSMGGAETLRVAPSRLDLFSHIGVFSMGLQGGHDAGVHPDFEERNAAFLGDPDRSNEMVKLLYVAAGEDDQIIGDGARKLSSTLARWGIQHEFHESEGGHTWINWRRYLYDFLPKLFL